MEARLKLKPGKKETKRLVEITRAVITRRFSLGKSISTRFIAILLLILVVGQGIGACLFLTSIRAGFMDALHGRMQRQVKQASGVLSEAAATYNTTLIEAYITETMKDYDIQAIRVLDRSGALLKEQVLQHDKVQSFTLIEPLSFVGVEAGTVELEYAARTIDESMQGSLLLIPVYQTGMLLVVAIVLVRLFGSYVKRPVEELSRALGRITGGDLAVEIPIYRNDEIGSIAEGVRFLAQRLSGTISRIDSISAKVTGAVQQLTATFDQVRNVVENQNESTAEISMAVREATETQQQIVMKTEQLLTLSGDNLSTLLQMHASSEEIAGTTDSLTTNIQSSHSTLVELATSAREVTRMADEVVSFVAEASSSIEEVYRSVKHVESTIYESAQLSTRTTVVISEKGMEAVSAVTAGMRRIGTFIDSHMAAIDRLGDRSRDIDKVLSVIEDVTDQSRLLSLNAQILAAQAGIQGKGFSVVAEEMKQLSDRAALSTREIAGIIGTIQKEIGTVVIEARECVTLVREGEIAVEGTTAALHEILESSRQATDLAKRIELASVEQTGGLKHIVNATEHIRGRISEVNRATSEQEKSTGVLLAALDPITEGMEATRRATGEQTRSSRFVSGNIELANQKNADIAEASVQQQQLNQRVLQALDAVVTMGRTTIAEVNGLMPHVTAMREEVEALRLELAGFTTIG